MVREDHEKSLFRISFNKLVMQIFYKFIQFAIEAKERFVIRMFLIPRGVKKEVVKTICLSDTCEEKIQGPSVKK